MTVFLTSITSNPYMLIFLINVFLLIVGMFMDTSAAIIILAPIFAPFALNLGFDPLHFGIIMVVNLVIGLATPPLGLCLFVASGISKLTMDEMVKSIIPLIAVEIIVLFIITYIPGFSLFVPRMLGY